MDDWNLTCAIRWRTSLACVITSREVSKVYKRCPVAIAFIQQSYTQRNQIQNQPNSTSDHVHHHPSPRLSGLWHRVLQLHHVSARPPASSLLLMTPRCNCAPGECKCNECKC
ncbi:hypothetical protein BDZ89DRAFT_219932 [Hymenopellis radicata]|nr:hypothetical protein BDZ89DRAFT_219932 [Hymenopellis radicata]